MRTSGFRRLWVSLGLLMSLGSTSVDLMNLMATHVSSGAQDFGVS